MPFLFIHMGLDPIAFHLGPIAVHWYGIGYVVAIFVGLRAAKPFALRRGLTEDQFWTLALWAIPAGFVGGRLYFVVQNHPGRFIENPGRLFEVWHGGMAFYGAIFSSFIIIPTVAFVRRWPVMGALDAAAMFAMMGQPIGRIGNLINGDIVGPPTSKPWGIIYTNHSRFAPDWTIAHHPAPLYEMVANLVLIAILFPIRHRLGRGWFVAAYVAGYSITQLIVFEWRTEPTVGLGLKQAQWTAIVVLGAAALIAAIALLRGSRPFRRPEAASPPTLAAPATAPGTASDQGGGPLIF
jgi:phosphatidylglycerol:prolipoprotein diacylglycerol transferase